MASGYFTPDALKAEMRSLDTELSIMQNDLANTENVPQNVTDGFAMFCEEWVAFVKDNSSWFARGLNVTNERISEFKRRAAYWLEIFKRAGIKTLSTAKAFDTSDSGMNLSIIPWWLWITAGGLLIWKLSPLRTAERVKYLTQAKSGKKK